MTTQTKDKLGTCFWCGGKASAGSNCCPVCFRKLWRAPEFGPYPAYAVHDAIHLTPEIKSKPGKLSSPDDWLNWRISEHIKAGETGHECAVCGHKHLTATRPAHADWASDTAPKPRTTPDKQPLLRTITADRSQTADITPDITADTVLASCGHQAKRPARGPLPRFCSDACRKRASRT